MPNTQVTEAEFSIGLRVAPKASQGSQAQSSRVKERAPEPRIQRAISLIPPARVQGDYRLLQDYNAMGTVPPQWVVQTKGREPEPPTLPPPGYLLEKGKGKGKGKTDSQRIEKGKGKGKDKGKEKGKEKGKDIKEWRRAFKDQRRAPYKEDITKHPKYEPFPDRDTWFNTSRPSTATPEDLAATQKKDSDRLQRRELRIQKFGKILPERLEKCLGEAQRRTREQIKFLPIRSHKITEVSTNPRDWYQPYETMPEQDFLVQWDTYRSFSNEIRNLQDEPGDFMLIPMPSIEVGAEKLLSGPPEGFCFRREAVEMRRELNNARDEATFRRRCLAIELSSEEGKFVSRYDFRNQLHNLESAETMLIMIEDTAMNDDEAADPAQYPITPPEVQDEPGQPRDHHRDDVSEPEPNWEETEQASNSRAPIWERQAWVVMEEAAAISDGDSYQLLTIDCGATGSLVALATLDRWQALDLIQVHSINPEVRKKYRVANGQSIESVSQVTLEFSQVPELGAVTFDAVDEEQIPTLLGMNVLSTSTLDIRNKRLNRNGKNLPLEQRPNGHLVLRVGYGTQNSKESSPDSHISVKRKTSQIPASGQHGKTVYFRLDEDDDADQTPELTNEYSEDEALTRFSKPHTPVHNSVNRDTCLGNLVLSETKQVPGKSRDPSTFQHASSQGREQEGSEEGGAPGRQRGRTVQSRQGQKRPTSGVFAGARSPESSALHSAGTPRASRRDPGSKGHRRAQESDDGNTAAEQEGSDGDQLAPGTLPGDGGESHQPKADAADPTLCRGAGGFPNGVWEVSREDLHGSGASREPVHGMGQQARCIQVASQFPEDDRSAPAVLPLLSHSQGGGESSGTCIELQGTSLASGAGVRVWKNSKTTDKVQHPHRSRGDLRPGRDGHDAPGHPGEEAVSENKHWRELRLLDRDRHRHQGQGDQEEVRSQVDVNLAAADDQILSSTVVPTSAPVSNTENNCEVPYVSVPSAGSSTFVLTVASNPEANSQSLETATTEVPSWHSATKFSLQADSLHMITCSKTERENLIHMLHKLKPASESKPVVTRIIEFCCDENSAIGIVAGATANTEVLRCTERHDVLTHQGLQRVLDYAKVNKGCHLWASIPCTAWSSIQNLNLSQHGESFAEYLDREKGKSLKLMGAFIKVAREVLAGGGEIAFEWPRYSTGWHEKLTQRWMNEFKTQTVVLDGCSQDLRSIKTGELIKKPWRLETTCESLASAFQNCLCTGDHIHTPCEGSETKRTGFYPMKMAKRIVQAFRRHDISKYVLETKDNKRKEEANLLEDLAGAATQEEVKAFLELSKKEQTQLLDAARKVHINTGHKPPSELARLLRKNQAPLASRAAMEQIKCSTCHEHGRPQPAPVATLSSATTPWRVLGMDVKEYSTPTEKLKYLMLVDEATRLVKCKLMFRIEKKKHRNVTTSELISTFEEEWETTFGCPEILHHDPEGAMVSSELMQEMASKGIRLTATAGEAHWQLGVTERTIQTIFQTAEKIRDEIKIPMDRAVNLAVAAHNTTERIHGFTPSQWAFGRNPTWSNTLHEEGDLNVNISRDGSEAFQEKLRQQLTARRVFEEEILRQKIQRAQRAKHRKDHIFVPGELVFIWRMGVGKIKGTSKTGLHKGAWIGPGVILGTESKEVNGNIFPCSIIWVVINDRLWRCAPEQIRRSSEREHSEHVLKQVRPWTFEDISKNLILGQFRNVAEEEHPEEQDVDMNNPENAGVEPENEDSENEDHDQELPPAEPEPKRRHPGESQGNGRRYSKKMRPNQNLEKAANLAVETGRNMSAAFFTKAECPDRVLEISFPELEDDRQIRKYLRDPEAFVVTSLRKKRVEIVEKRLNSEEKELIRTAKGKEIREFLKEAVVARLKDGEIVDPKDVMKMRWVLTWKRNEDGTPKGKARLVVLGFQDPHLGTENTSAPTLNRRSKQILLQTVVQREWKLKKGDVTAAFLQGRPLQKSKYALAPAELAEAMNLPQGERVIRLVKSVYGLTTAPLEWYSQVDKVLKELGGIQTAADPCVWVFTASNGEHIGIIGAHVDDFLIAGEGAEWEKFLEILLAAFRWTPWEESTFKQCGISVEQQTDGSIIQHQEEYLAAMSEIEISADRAKMLNTPVTETERTQLRALLGGLQWLVTQTRVDGMIDVNLLQSCVTTATVENLNSANKILRKLRQGPPKMFNRKIDGPLHIVAWSDASWANRRDGKSTGGFLIGICGEGVLDGNRGHVSIISWGTNKLKRVARSSMAAEMQALANAEDELHLCRLAWLEFNGKAVDLNYVDSILHEIPGTVVIDAKSIYDALTSQNQPTQLSEKRTALELIAYLRNTEANGTITRWVHGGANLADGLTKLGVHPMLREFLETSTWALVNDGSQLSGKRRKEQGLDKLGTNLRSEIRESNFYTHAMRALSTMWPDFVRDDSSADET